MNNNERFEDLIELSIEINKIQDIDILLEKILSCARKIVNADAGSLYIRKGNKLVFRNTQNHTLSKNLPPGKKLVYTIFEIPINQNSIAGYVAITGEILNIRDVYQLDESMPYHFNQEYDLLSNYKTTSMLTVPLLTNYGEIVGVLQIINSMDKEGHIIPFDESDEKYILHFANIATVVIQRAEMTRALLLRMNQMAELRDPKETGAHVNRVAAYAVEIYEKWAQRNKIPVEEIEKTRDILRIAAMLHDVGKIAISDLILKKPTKFTPEEFEIMKMHTILGARLFVNNQSNFDEIAKIVALNHHENWDGTGYPGHVDIIAPDALLIDPNNKPQQKKGEEIPLYGRIVAIADVYDALSSDRVYKKAWDEKDVLAEIKKESGKKFDPHLVEIFFELLEEIHLIKSLYKEKEN